MVCQVVGLIMAYTCKRYVTAQHFESDQLTTIHYHTHQPTIHSNDLIFLQSQLANYHSINTHIPRLPSFLPSFLPYYPLSTIHHQRPHFFPHSSIPLHINSAYSALPPPLTISSSNSLCIFYSKKSLPW